MFSFFGNFLFSSSSLNDTLHNSSYQNEPEVEPNWNVSIFRKLARTSRLQNVFSTAALLKIH